MLFANKVTRNKQQFIEKVREIAAKLDMNADDLMAVMWFESKLNEKAKNPVSGAVGLIQFMPNTAIGLGTTSAKLLTMSNLQQLDYVYNYYKPYAGRIKNFEDAYTITFFPAALGKPDSYTLQTSTLSAQLIASQNKIFDLNKDNKITAGELRKYMRDNWVKMGALDPVNNPPDELPKPEKKSPVNWYVIAGTIVLIGGITYFLTKKQSIA